MALLSGNKTIANYDVGFDVVRWITALRHYQ